jgi:branched-chain amino acid transport system ATP-binding protein
MTDSSTPFLSSAGELENALVAQGVGVRFEGLLALDSVHLRLGRGEILGLIGPNGAGKTTLVNVLSGYQKPTAGHVLMDGADSAAWRPHIFPRRGLGRTFQAARLFPEMTVLENVELPGVSLGLSRKLARERASEILEFFDMLDRRSVIARALSYGEERLVGIARALAISPKYLLLDEPAAGLSPQEALDLTRSIASARDRFGCGVLVIEHNMQLIMKLCDRVQVLAQGKTIAVGTPGEVQRSVEVRSAYLGAPGGSGVPAAAEKKQRAIADGPLLSVDRLVVDYGSIRALSGVTLSVRPGELVSVIGPNGAGKSSMLAAITGLIKASSGTIEFDGRPLNSQSTEQRVKTGISLVPEGRRILTNLTVEENLRVGLMARRHDQEAERRLEGVLELFPVLRARLKGYAGRLSGGEQQQLAIARALLSDPKLLLLDEPSLGLAPMVIEQVYQTLIALNEAGLSILLMEQNANRALLAADRAYVLRHGHIELEGSAAKLREDPAFDRAYFGFETHEGVAFH